MAVLFEAPHPRGLAASDAFTIHLPLLSKAGHETLTQRAAAPLVAAGRLSAADVAGLVRGVRAVDLNPLNHVAPSRQRRHFLRASRCQPVAAAHAEGVSWLRALFVRALAASGPARWPLAGEALHLIQDSYSRAHVERAREGTGAIRFIRYYGLGGKGFPQEHKLPSDPRDHIATETRAADAAVRASGAFLGIVLRAAAPGASPAVRSALFARYVRAFFRLDPAHRTTSSVYPSCPGPAAAPAVPGPAREAEHEVDSGAVNRVIAGANAILAANPVAPDRRQAPAIQAQLHRLAQQVFGWIDRATPQQIDAVVGRLGAVESRCKVSSGLLRQLRARALQRLRQQRP